MPETNGMDKSAFDRQAGVLLHVSSLPGPYGIGEIGAQALAFVDTMRAMNLAVWQFLPLGPTAYGDSPYQPLSSFAGNEMLIDVGDLVERGLVRPDETRQLERLPSDFVDYAALIPAKERVLALAARRFEEQADEPQSAAYCDFVEQNNDAWLHDYALFRVLKSQHDNQPWTEWAPDYVMREPSALATVATNRADRIEAIKILQFLFFEQWQRLRDYAHQSGIRLFGDMPIYLALDSADAWASRDLLMVDEQGQPSHVAGVPPDYFSADGQLWGNPLYDWPQHEATGYQWWIDRVRAATGISDIVRIDHFRGFESYWAVPAGAETARDGTWQPGPRDALFDALRNALGELPIVAEDLGDITDDVNALRDRQNMPGMVVLQFAVMDEDFSLAGVRRNCVIYTGTHDNDTTQGWFRSTPDDTRTAEEVERTRHIVLSMTGGNEDTVAFDLVRAAFSTDARLAIAPLQDYLELGSEARVNTPGSPADNWRWRVSVTQLTDELCHNVKKAVQESGREMLDVRRPTA